jgi:hypothetical protein
LGKKLKRHKRKKRKRKKDDLEIMGNKKFGFNL